MLHDFGDASPKSVPGRRKNRRHGRCQRDRTEDVNREVHCQIDARKPDGGGERKKRQTDKRLVRRRLYGALLMLAQSLAR